MSKRAEVERYEVRRLVWLVGAGVACILFAAGIGLFGAWLGGDMSGALFLMFVVGILGGVLIAFAFLSIPGAVARCRAHPDHQAIDVCGMLGCLFAGIPWLIGLVWAYSGDAEERWAEVEDAHTNIRMVQQERHRELPDPVSGWHAHEAPPSPRRGRFLARH